MTDYSKVEYFPMIEVNIVGAARFDKHMFELIMESDEGLHGFRCDSAFARELGTKIIETADIIDERNQVRGLV